MTWYKQSSVWAVTISVVALILSQLPPISDWFPTNQLEVDIGKEIGVTTNLGMPGYYLLVDFDNQGNRMLTVSKLQLEVVWPNGSTRTIDESYYTDLQGNQSFTPTTLKFKPQERWTSYLAFNPKMSPNEEEIIGQLKQKFSNSIFEKRRNLPPQNYTPETTVEVDQNLVEEARKLFDQRRSGLETGLYKATLSCERNGERVKIKTFEFTLYPYHIETLRSQANDFKWGWGVSASPDRSKELWVTILRVD